MRKFAPEKRPETIRGAMAQVRLEGEAAKDKTHTGRKPRRFAPAGQSTQMIIGADGADDVTILKMSTRLYSGYKLRRVYYSAFSPIPDASAALPLIQPPLLREHRLYQADWLLRFMVSPRRKSLPVRRLVILIWNWTQNLPGPYSTVVCFLWM